MHIKIEILDKVGTLITQTTKSIALHIKLAKLSTNKQLIQSI